MKKILTMGNALLNGHNTLLNIFQMLKQYVNFLTENQMPKIFEISVKI